MKPRIFLSAVTREFATARERAAKILLRLGYDPVFEEIFGTEPGDIRPIPRRKLDDCQGLIQFAGHAYGAEPPVVDPALGRVSYTQFELHYARSRGIKTWLIFAEDGCERDRPM